MQSERTERLVLSARERAADRRRSFAWAPDASEPPPVRRSAPSGRPLRVLLSNAERTLFNYVADPRLIVSVLEPGKALETPPDVFVVTRADRNELNDSVRNLPPELWARAADGRLRLVFDASGEGLSHSAFATEQLHGFLRARGVQPSAAAYVTQDRQHARDYGAYCDSQGIGADRMRIWVHDLYIQRTFAPLRGDGEATFHSRLAAYAARAPERRRQFTSLNRTIRPVKALFLLRLMQAGIWDRGYISLGRLGEVGRGEVLDKKDFLALLRAQPGFDDLFPALEPCLDQLYAIGPIRLGMREDLEERKAQRWSLEPMALEQYARSWFSVVTESHASDWLHRITEKPFKPLLNFHPFMVLGCTGALRLVRAYGFDTYPQMFDESYDDTLPLRARHDMILAETRRLCGLDQAALARLDEAAAQTVVFNAWWGLVELPALFVSHIDAQLIDQLADLCASPVAL